MLMNELNLAHVTDVVLASGGWESTLCAVRANAYAAPVGRRALLLFYDYGQQYAAQEWRAVQRMSEVLSIGCRHVELVRGFFTQLGAVVVGRNAHFIRTSRTIAPNATHLWFGCRAPSPWFDKYQDSNVQWAREAARAAGYRQTFFPALLMPKFLVQRAVRKAGIKDAMVFSSEGLVP